MKNVLSDNSCKIALCRYHGTMELPFRKMHGLGNDFVILDGRAALPVLTPEIIRLMADRRRGVGCDQLIVLEPTTGTANVFMRIYNPDASEAGACGNATRCVADILMHEKGVRSCLIETISGQLSCKKAENSEITVNMGAPGLIWNQIPLSHEVDTLHLPLNGDPAGVSMGNPHCVFFCEQVEDMFVDKLGPLIEHDPLFPERTNVEYVSVRGADHIRMRVWERGAGVTQACGTGACAATVAAIRRGLTGRTVRVTLDGGDLVIYWDEKMGDVFMTGPVAYSFEGVFGL